MNTLIAQKKFINYVSWVLAKTITKLSFILVPANSNIQHTITTACMEILYQKYNVSNNIKKKLYYSKSYIQF